MRAQKYCLRIFISYTPTINTSLSVACSTDSVTRVLPDQQVMALHKSIFCLLLFQVVGGAGGAKGSSKSQTCVSKNITLHLVVMAPLPDETPGLEPGWEGGPAVIPGSMVAVDDINSRCDVLRDYHLELLVADSGCDVSSKAAINTLSNLFYSDYRVIGIIGPGCSEATAVVGKLLASDRISLLNIAPSATSPALVNSTTFPNTFRPIASSLGFINVYTDFISFRKYTNVTILFEAARDFHKVTASRFQKRLQAMNMSVSSFGMFDSFIPLTVFRNNFRIIFVFSGGGMSRKLICFAYHKNMIYPTYQFIFSDRRLGHFIADVSFVLDGTKFECSKEKMKQAIVGIILNTVQLTRTDRTTMLVSNTDYLNFAESYNIALEDYKNELNLSKVVDTEHQSGYYDSTWAFALSLDAAIPRLEERFNGSLSDYRFGYPAVTEVIRSELLNISFEGVRGTVQFSNETQDGANVTVLNMVQIQFDGMEKQVGSYNPARSPKERLQIFDDSLFISDEFTIDAITPPIFVLVLVLIAWLVAMCSVLVFHALNTLWVSAKSMKVTSPSLNHMIFSGCYLYLLSVLIITLQLVQGVQYPVLFGVGCSAFMWCESMALTLIFGTICVKLWRVYRIFSHTSADVLSNLEDYRLVMYVLVLLLVDIVFNVAWNLVNPWFLHTAAQDQLRIRVICNCNNIIIWLSCLMTLKIGLGFVVFYLSLLTRRIPKREYKQTKSVNALIYSLIFLYCFTIPVHLILLGSTNVSLITVSYLALCFKNLLCIILCSIFIFLPPILPVLRLKWRNCVRKQDTINHL